MACERTQVSTLLDRLEEAPERLIVVTGLRQTGKTTLVRQALGRAGLPYRYLRPWTSPSRSPSLPFPATAPPVYAARSTSKAATLRSLRLNSTPIRWIGRPRWRYLSA